jgi:uncharacterized OB-fold protein
MHEYPELESSRLARERALHASEGTLTFQTSQACGQAQYPCRYVCQYCLGDDLSWTRISSAGQVLATALVHRSLHPFFQERVPWRICSVLLAAGPRVIAHASDPAIESGTEVSVRDHHVSKLQCVLIAEKRCKSAGDET